MKIPYLRIILMLVGFLIGVWLLWPRPDPPVGQAGPQLPVTPGQSHVRQDTPQPSGQPPDRNIRGKLRITIKLPPRKNDSGQTVQEEIPIDVLIPRKEEEAPIVNAPDLPEGSTIDPVYTDYRDPFFKIRLNLLVGASVDPAIGPSPYAAISFLSIAEKVHIAAGADRWALGPAIHWEIFREWDIGARWPLIQFTKENRGASFSIAYRF
jgi:hypothetical protein